MSATQQPLQVVSTLSAPYSGSTLLAILLNRHAAISSDGETFPVQREKRMTCSCGEQQIDCPYYRLAARHMLLPGGNDWDRSLFAHVPLYSRLYLLDRALGGFWMRGVTNNIRNLVLEQASSYRQTEARFIEAHERFIAESLRIRNASVYVDGSKSLRRAELMARSGQFDCKALHLIRDPRAFANSFLKNNALSRRKLSRAIQRWRKNIRKVELYRERFPAIPYLMVSYEDLCREPEASLRRVCAFLKISYDPAMTEVNTDAFHVIGNRMRMNFDGKVRFDQAWQHELSPSEVAEITESLRPEINRYGYIDLGTARES